MYLKLLICDIIKLVSKNVFSDFAIKQRPDNPQEIYVMYCVMEEANGFMRYV